MQRHQTSTPPVRPRPRPLVAALGFLAIVLVATACSTATQFTNETVAVDADGMETSGTDPISAGMLGETSVAAANPDRAAGLQSSSGSNSQNRPVLEVTRSGSQNSSDAGALDDAADPGTAGTAAAPTSTTPIATPAQESESGAPGSMSPATTAPPATEAPQTQAPDTASPDTAAQVTEATATTAPATEAPVIDASTPTAVATTSAPRPAAATTPEPDCAVLCNIAMEGDSLTVGLGNRLCGAVKTGNCINSGIVGRRVDEMIVTARTDVDNQLGTETNDVLILWAGTNDLWQKYHSTDPATNAGAVYDKIKEFVAERRAKGWDRIYVMTLPPMNPTYVVGTEPLNELIRQNTAGADGILDVGADTRLSNAFDPAMRAADGIHFGDGGRAVVMEYVLGAIRNLDGI